MPLTPSERVMRARLAAHHLHAQGKTNTVAARDALLARFEREVDPDGTLDPAERARRADHARKAHYVSLALRSAASRRRARHQAADADAADAELAVLGDTA